MTELMDLKKITTPILLHLLKGRVRFPLFFMLRCKLTAPAFKRRTRKRFPQFPAELIELAGLPAWVYLNLKERLGQAQAFEIMRVAILTGGTALQNMQYQTVDKPRTFRNFIEGELANNRAGLVRFNTLQVVERTERRFEMKVTRCMFHELSVALGMPELTPVICGIDNAFFNSYLPDGMMFSRGGPGHRISDGAKACTFVWDYAPEK